MSDAGINHYTFHSEATNDIEGCIRKIREAGMKVYTVHSTFGANIDNNYCARVCT